MDGGEKLIDGNIVARRDVAETLRLTKTIRGVTGTCKTRNNNHETVDRYCPSCDLDDDASMSLKLRWS